MMFGDPSIFAIEIYHEPDGIQWLGFGRMCLHIGGQVIGDIHDENCSLFHAVDRLASLSATIRSAWDMRFRDKNDVEIFSWLDAHLYSGALRPPTASLQQFDFLTNTGEQFDAHKSFIYCAPGGQVHILFDDRAGHIHGARCDVTVFVAQIERLHGWFVDEVRRPDSMN